MVLLRHRCKSPYLEPLLSRVFAGVLQKLWAVLDGDLYRQNEQNCWTWRAALSYESQTRTNSPDLSCSEVTQMLWMASGFVYSLAHVFIKVDGYGLTETHKPYQIHSHSHSPLKLWYLTHTAHTASVLSSQTTSNTSSTRTQMLPTPTTPNHTFISLLQTPSAEVFSTSRKLHGEWKQSSRVSGHKACLRDSATLFTILWISSCWEPGFNPHTRKQRP